MADMYIVKSRTRRPMRQRIWGKHGAIIPRTRRVIKLTMMGLLAVAIQLAPLAAWLLK